MSVLTLLISSKIAVGVVTLSVVGVGGTAAVAMTGTLPAPLQEQAHRIVGAPAPTETSEPSDDATPTAAPTTTAAATPEPTDSTNSTNSTETTSTPSTAPSTQPAVTSKTTLPANVHGLCTAYVAGGLSVSSVAYARLSDDARSAGSTIGGAADLSGFCSTVGVVKIHHQSDETVGSASEDGVEQDATGTESESESHRGGAATSTHAKHGDRTRTDTSTSTDASTKADDSSADSGTDDGVGTDSQNGQGDSGGSQGTDQQDD